MSDTMSGRRAGFADTKEHNESEGRGGQRVGGEEDQVIVLSDQSREQRSDGRAEIDRPVVISIGAGPRSPRRRQAGRDP
jgi:hypothetical protein